MQTWSIRTDMRLDNDDNDYLGGSVEYETFPHDYQMTTQDWMFGDVEDVEYDDSGSLCLIVYGRFDTEYDRSAEVHYPVYTTTTVERIEGGA